MRQWAERLDAGLYPFAFLQKLLFRDTPVDGREWPELWTGEKKQLLASSVFLEVSKETPILRLYPRLEMWGWGPVLSPPGNSAPLT